MQWNLEHQTRHRHNKQKTHNTRIITEPITQKATQTAQGKVGVGTGGAQNTAAAPIQWSSLNSLATSVQLPTLSPVLPPKSLAASLSAGVRVPCCHSWMLLHSTESWLLGVPGPAASSSSSPRGCCGTAVS